MELSEKIKEYLVEINDPVSQYLLTLHNNSEIENNENIDSADVSNEDDSSISFTKNGRSTKHRIKAGRFIAKFTDQFSARDIELFVNKFKSISLYNNIKQNFEIGMGDDFIFSYDLDNYSELTGSLRGSCMNNCGENRLKLYVSNPKKIKILMLKDGDGKLMGRAVLWHKAFIREGETADDRNAAETIKCNIMDRVYSTKDYIVEIFEKYATENGWYIRRGGLSFINPSKEDVKCRVKINLRDFEYGNYPYLDTMRSVSKNGTISNKRWKAEVRFY